MFGHSNAQHVNARSLELLEPSGASARICKAVKIYNNLYKLIMQVYEYLIYNMITIL